MKRTNIELSSIISSYWIKVTFGITGQKIVKVQI